MSCLKDGQDFNQQKREDGIAGGGNSKSKGTEMGKNRSFKKRFSWNLGYWGNKLRSKDLKKRWGLDQGGPS